MLENLAAEELFALLRGRGHVVDEVRWPDRERKGVKGSRPNGAKTVDLTFLQNGWADMEGFRRVLSPLAPIAEVLRTVRVSAKVVSE